MCKPLFCAASFGLEAPPRASSPAFSARSAARRDVCPSLPRRAARPFCSLRQEAALAVPCALLLRRSSAAMPPKGRKAKRISETRTNTLTFVRIYGIIIWRKRQTAAQTPRAGMQKYPSGSRGSPAKGVVRDNRSAGSNPAFCAISSPQGVFRNRAGKSLLCLL